LPVLLWKIVDLPLDCVRAGVKNERVGGDVVKKGLWGGGVSSPRHLHLTIG